jgi:glycosyltransferase involved in cell wall biosynthesis
MPAPAVAVVVPARNSAATIGATLDAIAASDFDGDYELVVVDDGSTDATPEIAERLGARVVRLEGQHGPAGARNAGIAATSAPLLAFTDADCTPTRGWLRAVVEALADADLVTGPVLPEEGVRVGPFDRTLRLPDASARFETANLAVRRATAEAVGGFEPFAPVPGRPEVGLRPRPDQGHFGEDVVFGWRAVRAGARRAFARDALVHHAVFPRGPRGYVVERWRLRYFPALVREVPELRNTLPARVFLSRRTLRFDAALAGLAFAAVSRRAVPAALAIPYVRRDLRTWQPFTRGGVVENGALVLGDAVGLAALLRGALAARRLLL